MANLGDPPPPLPGFQILKDSEVTPELTAFAVEVHRGNTPLHGTVTRSFPYAVLARVETHPADARNPVMHEGVTLYRGVHPTPPGVVVPPSSRPPTAQPPVPLPPVPAPTPTRKRTVGADTAYPVTQRLLNDATRVMGQAPAFWGRYFTSVHAAGNVEYRHRVEDALLAANNIRVLPIARQTNRVSLGLEDGRRDGRANADDLIQTFSEQHLVQLGGQIMIFLDVEGSGRSILSSAYYAGWAAGLAEVNQNVQFLPCVYGLPTDSATWTALKTAREQDAPCRGIWLARWVPDVEPVAWSPARTRPSVDPGVPVLAWQYTSPRDGAAIDRNLVNPALDAQAELLRFLILPPG
jgi:hypothetical protein